MIRIFKGMFWLFFLVLFFVAACENQRKPYFDNLNESHKISVGEPLDLTIKYIKGGIDSIQYFIDSELVATKLDTSKFIFDTASLEMGEHSASAVIFLGAQIENLRLSSSFSLYPPAPKLFRYEVINKYPHDSLAYTQGLEYHKGTLFETTGIKGKSSLRKVDVTTGKVLQSEKLDDRYFGEGMTTVGELIYVLTYKDNTCLVYDSLLLALVKTFSYEKEREGWGLTYNGSELIKSVGSNMLYFIDPNTFEDIDSLSVFDNNGPVNSLNELEYINGKIYANVYQEDYIVIVNPLNGVVEERINLIGIYKHKPVDNELNGIAFNREENTLYITGKMWPFLFEIKPVKL